MPTFSNQVPHDPRGLSLPLKRCPVGKPVIAIVTSLDLIGCKTHFYQGKTQPCENETCKACLDGVRWTWHSYLSAYDHAAKLHFLFESTARATEAFVQYREAHDVLRGCLFRAQRTQLRANARVYIETRPADLEKYSLPNPPDLTKILAIIWNLPDAVLAKGRRIKNVPNLTPEEEALEQIRRRINGTMPQTTQLDQQKPPG